MKKTVRIVDYLLLLFSAWGVIFLHYDTPWLAVVALSAATICLGVSIGSFAYDVFHEARSRREGGE